MDSEIKRQEIATAANPVGHHFSPYEMNGGTLIAVAGADYVIVASDTRLSEGYSILSRDEPHTFALQPHCMIGCVGFHGDCLTFVKKLEIRLRMYEYENSLKTMSTPAIAQLASTLLYYKRFFPYYVNTIVGGLMPDGQGAVYSYDPVGSFEREMYRASGSSAALIQPLLDSQFGLKNLNGNFTLNKSLVCTKSRDAAVAIVRDAFISAAERDIYCGDSVTINVITKDGVKTEHYPLRKD